jgi:hypothetical protein
MHRYLCGTDIELTISSKYVKSSAMATRIGQRVRIILINAMGSR